MLGDWIRAFFGRGRTPAPTSGSHAILAVNRKRATPPDTSVTAEELVSIIHNLNGFSVCPVGIELMEILNERGYVKREHRLALADAMAHFEADLPKPKPYIEAEVCELSDAMDRARFEVGGSVRKLAQDTYMFKTGDIIYFEHNRWCYGLDETALEHDRTA